MVYLGQEPGAGRGSPDPRTAVRTAQIIYFALMAGLVTFGAVLFVVPTGAAGGDGGGEGDGPPAGLLMLIAGFLTATMAVPAVLFSGRVVRTSAGASGLDSARRSQRYVAGKVLTAALIEGPGLLWGVIALITGEKLPLIGLAFSVVALALVLPREQEWSDATGLR